MKSASSSSISASVCGSYNFNGTTLTASGIYKDTLTNAAGCDSIITLTLNMKSASSSSISASACGSYNFSGITLTSSGIYTDTLTNAAGCDSIITLTLNMKSASSSSISASVCGSYNFNGTTLTASGIYTDTLTNAAGCDSIITLTLNIRNATSASISATSCGQYIFHNQTLTSSGTYKDTIANNQGCDSIITLNLTINPLPKAGTISSSRDSICAGSTVNFTATGTANGTLQWQVKNGNSWTNTGAANTNPLNNISISTDAIYRLKVSNTLCGYDTSNELSINVFSIWTGAIDTSWIKGGNWCSGVVPGITSNILIPSGVPNYPSISSGATAKKIVIAQGATLKANNGTVLVIAGSMFCNGTFNAKGGTTEFSKGNSTIPSVTFHILKLGDSGNYTLTGNVKANSNFFISKTNTTLNTVGYNIEVLGDPTIEGFIKGTGKLIITRASGYASLYGNGTVEHVVLNSSAAGGVRSMGNFNILDSMIINSGSWQINNSTSLTLGALTANTGAFINLGVGISAGSSSTTASLYIYGNNAAATIQNMKFAVNKLILNRPAGIKLTGTSYIYHEATLSNGKLDIGSQTLNIGATNIAPIINTTVGSFIGRGNGTLAITGNSSTGVFNNIKFDSLYNLNFNSPNGMTLGSNIYINGQVKTYSGKIDLNGKIITLAANASISETAGSTFTGNSGYLTITKNYTSPISNENIAGLGFVLTTNQTPGLVTITRGHNYFTSASGNSIRRYFGMKADKDTGLQIQAYFNYDSTELFGADRKKLRFSQSNNAGTSWIGLLGANSTSGNTATGYSYRKITTLPDSGAWFTLSDSVNSPLARELITSIQSTITAINYHVFPNPFNEHIYITFESTHNEALQINLYDLNGRVVYRKQINTSVGPQSLEIMVPEMTRGIYILKVESTQGYKAYRVVKE
jgi:hypothetical protein